MSLLLPKQKFIPWSPNDLDPLCHRVRWSYRKRIKKQPFIFTHFLQRGFHIHRKVICCRMMISIYCIKSWGSLELLDVKGRKFLFTPLVTRWGRSVRECVLAITVDWELEEFYRAGWSGYDQGLNALDTLYEFPKFQRFSLSFSELLIYTWVESYVSQLTNIRHLSFRYS